MLIKFKCPEDQVVTVIKVPFSDKNSYIQLIRNGFNRCFKCGQNSTLHTIKKAGPWTLFKMLCPEHKTTKEYKIWTTIYDEASEGSIQKQGPLAEETVEEEIEKEYCNNCGTERDFTRNIKFCPKCGAPMD